MKFILLLSTFLSMTVNSSPVGSRFSYQGKLELNDTPVNGIYDLKFEAWSQETGGGIIGSAIILEDIEVTKGIFTVELDFGDATFMGDDVFLKIQVREGSTTGSYTALFPKQRINATPYAIQADFLAANGALTGQVLKFNGSEWTAGNDDTSTVWQSDSNGAFYDDHIGIGGGSSTAFSLAISSPAGTAPFSTNINGQPKLQVASNGGVSVGSNVNVAPPPSNGLYVSGEVELNNTTTITDDLLVQKNAKHTQMDSYGFAKAGIEFSCGNAGTVRQKYFNNINNSEITVSNGVFFGSCSVNLPFDYDDLYYQTTVEFNGSTPIAGACNKGTQGGGAGTQVTICRMYNIETNSTVIVAERVTLLIF